MKGVSLLTQEGPMGGSLLNTIDVDITYYPHSNMSIA